MAPIGSLLKSLQSLQPTTQFQIAPSLMSEVGGDSGNIAEERLGRWQELEDQGCCLTEVSSRQGMEGTSMKA